MANLYGTNYTAAFVTIPSEKLPPGENTGKSKVAYDEYDLDGAIIAANDLIYMMKIPAGARILEMTLDSASLGTTGILQVGTLADPDRYIVSGDAGGQAIREKMPLGAAGAFEKLTVETQIIIKCTELSTATTGLVKLHVDYVLD